MTLDDAMRELAAGDLCVTLRALQSKPFGRGEYRKLVYSALLSANTLGYSTGLALGLTESGASVVNAVIALPTGIVMFRVPWYVGATGNGLEGIQDKAIDDFLAMSHHDAPPLMRYPNRCCTRCHVWESRGATYCNNTDCKCHRRR